ncbi:MAG TPA: hypothetical protein VK964_04140 [Nocardioidaceae bacterium]|nr:hypothetical protein [Nocardioidaceae bacterium]
MRRFIGRGSVFVVALLLAVTGPAATAATVVQRDARDDAPARFDIVRVTYVNNARVLSVKAKVVDLRPGRQAFGYTMDAVGIPPLRGGYIARTTLRRDGSVTAWLMRGDKKVSCPVRGRWRLGRDTVRLWYPQSCLRWHRTQRIQTYIGVPRPIGGDPADFTRPIRIPYR